MLNSVELKIVDSRIGKDPAFPLPAYGTDMAAGIDVVACIDKPVIIKPGERELIGFGISIFINDRNYAMLLLPRSGTAHKRHIGLSNSIGLLDADYQGEIKGSVRNLSNTEDIVIEPGERIGQIIFVPVLHPELKLVTEFSNLTERGAGGFGSTGTK